MQSIMQSYHIVFFTNRFIPTVRSSLLCKISLSCFSNRYVFVKTSRVSGEAFDVDEDVENFDIQILDYAEDDSMDEESEYKCILNKQKTTSKHYGR